MFAGDLAIAFGIFFGFVSLAVAVFFGISDKLRDFLSEAKKSQIDEKISILYVHAMGVKDWNSQKINTEFMIRRILSDIDSIGRIRKSIKDEVQLGALINAGKALTSELKTWGFNREITQIETIFEQYHLLPKTQGK
ncbi:MAG: hypothetical protein M3P08_04595 [Thermoproteota archaeon]|nr:hypothetical protein [Thermoproteota archaeon]